MMKNSPKTLNTAQRKIQGRRENGFSLIESLVSLLVLALGIMGLAGLQTRTLTETRLSNARSSAIQMAEDLNERMQFNFEARTQAINPYITNWGAPVALPGNGDCATNPCTAVQLAAYDLNQWKTTLGNLLPGGDARIFQSPSDPTQFGVLIGWTNNQAAAADAAYAQPFVVNSGVNNVTCQANMICHLVFIRP